MSNAPYADTATAYNGPQVLSAPFKSEEDARPFELHNVLEKRGDGSLTAQKAGEGPV